LQQPCFLYLNIIEPIF